MLPEIIYTLAAPAVLLLAQAAEIPPPPLAQNFDPVTFISSRLLAQVPPAEAVPRVEAILIQRKPCAEPGYHLTYRIVVRNRGEVPVSDLLIQNQYPGGTTWSAAVFPTAVRPPDEHDPFAHILRWREGFLAPGSFVNYTFTVRVGGGQGVLVNNLTVTFVDSFGRVGRVLTDNQVQAYCPAPALSATGERGDKQPVNIFCDLTQPGCVPVFPKLGINFQRAQAPEQQVRICSPTDPRACVANRPELGIRFAEAIADIIPGDCRVLSDDVIRTPDFQDALNRRNTPAAFYLVPLHEAGEDFKRLVLENALLGIGHLKQAQARLQSLTTPGEVAAALQDLQRDYERIQGQRGAKFDRLAEAAERKAEESLRRACGGLQNQPPAVIVMRERLGAAKIAYEQNLAARTTAYKNMQQIFLRQAPVSDRQAFDELFARTFVAHRREDEAADNRVRREEWEVALDIPKGVATECEAENLFAAPVESQATWCESNNYAAFSIANQGPARPPNLDSLPGAGPEPAASAGASCRGLPGDPWWASDCSCQCGQILPGADGTLRTCFDKAGTTKQITRHDILVTSQEECLADGPKHQDRFF